MKAAAHERSRGRVECGQTMAFDEKLAGRIRKRLGKRAGLVEKKMFGGVAFLLNGNMCCGVHGAETLVRLDPAQTDKALSEHHNRLFDLTGRPLMDWIFLEPKVLATDGQLR